VALVVVPAIVRTGVQENPGAPVGTMRMDRPLWRGASVSVRQASHT
jgi:hypothetical protein